MYFFHLQHPPFDAAVAPAPGANLWPPYKIVNQFVRIKEMKCLVTDYMFSVG